MFPWMKKRTPLGRWLDAKGKSQLWLAEVSGVSRNTIAECCNNEEYRPQNVTRRKIIKALIDQVDPDVSATDFW